MGEKLWLRIVWVGNAVAVLFVAVGLPVVLTSFLFALSAAVVSGPTWGGLAASVVIAVFLDIALLDHLFFEPKRWDAKFRKKWNLPPSDQS